MAITAQALKQKLAPVLRRVARIVSAGYTLTYTEILGGRQTAYNQERDHTTSTHEWRGKSPDGEIVIKADQEVNWSQFEITVGGRQMLHVTAGLSADEKFPLLPLIGSFRLKVFDPGRWIRRIPIKRALTWKEAQQEPQPTSPRVEEKPRQPKAPELASEAQLATARALGLKV